VAARELAEDEGGVGDGHVLEVLVARLEGAHDLVDRP